MTTSSMARRALLVIVLLATGGCQAPAPAPPAAEPSPAKPPVTSPAAALPSTSRQPTPTPGALRATDVRMETVTLPIPTPDVGSIVAFGSIWFADGQRGTVTRWDPSTRQVVKTFRVGDPSRAPYGDPKTLGASSDTVFVASPGTRSIATIDPATNLVGDAIELGDFVALPLFIDSDSLWTADFDAGVVERIDLRTGQVLATLPRIPQVAGLAGGFGAIWASSETGSLVKIDPATNTVVQTIRRPGGAGNIAIGREAVWSASFSDGTVTGFDPDSGALISTVQLSDLTLGMTAVGTSLWVTYSPKPPDCHDPGSSFITRIDQATGTVEGRLALDCPYDIIASGDTLWVGDGDSPQLTSITVLH